MDKFELLSDNFLLNNQAICTSIDMAALKKIFRTTEIVKTNDAVLHNYYHEPVRGPPGKSAPTDTTDVLFS